VTFGLAGWHHRTLHYVAGIVGDIWMLTKNSSQVQHSAAGPGPGYWYVSPLFPLLCFMIKVNQDYASDKKSHSNQVNSHTMQ
jgi:hypothetical protein